MKQNIYDLKKFLCCNIVVIAVFPRKLVPNKNYQKAKMSARKAPFSTFEKEFLRELIAPHSAVLESKKTDADYNKRKLLLWAEITKAYNNSSRCQEVSLLLFI